MVAMNVFCRVNDINFCGNSKIMSGDTEQVNKVSLRLGDIIEIEAQDDIVLDKKKFVIRYIDTNMLRLENSDGENEFAIINGRLENDAITGISLLSRQEHPGYAMQNGLVPGKRVNIRFATPTPFQINGEISGLNNDQIVVLTSEQRTIYIDFAYKGIPLDVPIESIVIEDDVIEETTTSESPDSDDISQDAPESAKSPTSTDTPDAIVDQEGVRFDDGPEPIVFKSDDIQFGEDLGFVTQLVELPESEKRFHIDKQTDDIMNNMLAIIPNAERENDVIDEIHVMINRFKELREEFSIFDTNDNSIAARKHDDKYKPLAESLETLDRKYYWMIPVATLIKKLYDVNADTELEDEENGNDEPGSVLITLAKKRIDEADASTRLEEGGTSYLEHLKQTQTFSTPFINASQNASTYLSSKEVKTPLTAIIDNSDDFKTSVVTGNSELAQKKFFTQEYVVAQNVVDAETEGGVSKATPNDKIAIKSFVTLPDSTVRFSRINAPSTSLLAKTGLNETFLHYWQVFKERTRPVNVDVDVSRPQPLSPDGYLRNITHYRADDDSGDQDQDQDQEVSAESQSKYRQYLDNIVPSSLELFKVIQPHIQGSHSIHKIASHLEPFAIDPGHITNSVYREMYAFIQTKIKKFSDKLEKSLNELSVLSIEPTDSISGLRIMFESAREKYKYNVVMEGYGITEDMRLTDDEIYTRAMAIDQCRFLNTGVSLVSIRLMILHDSPCVEDFEEMARVKREEEKNREPDDCNKYILSKKYVTLEELESDNNKDVFYDKRYDNTYYDLITEYAVELERIEEEDAQQIFLAQKLQEVNGLNNAKAMREAEAMLANKRKVVDGDYAVLDNEDAGSNYYRRENNSWVSDPTVNEGLMTDETKLFCNFNEKCTYQEKTCNSMETEKETIERKIEEQLIGEFEKALKVTKDQYTKKIIKAFDKAKENVRVLRILHEKGKKIGVANDAIFFEADEADEGQQSPYEKIRDTILGQSDFVQKQKDIRRFIRNFTRAPNLNEDESLFWLYCNQTNTKLLPSYYQEISDSFIDGLDYIDVIGKICDKRGVLGDDGSAWVDKHSGYIITHRSFDQQEGFTEEGFRINTREVMEEDPMIPDDTNTNKPDEYANKETTLIMRVVDDMGKFMGIHIEENENDMIRRLSKQSLREKLMSKNSYDKLMKQEKKKSKKPDIKFPTYEDYKSELIMVITLSCLLVCIQTSIPQIKFGKQYPGCSRSFTGYPLETDGSKGIEYIACVANKIKRSVEPWNAISSAKKLIKKMTKELTLLVAKSEIKSRLENKRSYLKNEENRKEMEGEVMPLYSNALLLPLLVPVEIPNIVPSPKEFYDSLEDSMRTSQKDQHLKLNAMQGKKIFVALRIQHLIEKAIRSEIGTKSAILTTSTEEPYVENACCSDGEPRPFEYFSTRVPQLKELNTEARIISSQLGKSKMLRSPRILFAPMETKIKFPKISMLYSDSTKYRAMATLCGANDMDTNDTSQEICPKNEETGNDNSDKTLEEKIQALENNGLQYTDTHVMDLVASRNSKHTFEWKQPTLLRRDYETFPEFEEAITELRKNDVEGLIDIIETIKEPFNDFLGSVLKKPVYKKYISSLKAVSSIFENEDANEELGAGAENNFDERSFCLNTLRYVCLIIPSVINTRHFVTSNIVPKHWKLSEYHVGDIETFAKKKFERINASISKISINRDLLDEQVKTELENVAELFSLLISVEDNVNTEYLFEFCLFTAMNVYKNALSGRVDDSNIAQFMHDMVRFIADDINNIVYDYSTLERKITASKEKEKMSILKRLENKTEEQREIDTLKKNNKLGEEWGKGLQKNLRVYDAEGYDKERIDGDGVNKSNYEIAEEQENDQILMPDDDNFEDGDDGDDLY